jgi:hypothetical protein
VPGLTLRGAFLALLLGLGASGARAVEPVTVTVHGRATTEASELGGGRDRAIDAAMVEATLEVARGILRVETLPEEVESLREALAPLAPALILTYRIEPGGKLRPKPGEPGTLEYLVRVTATVDAAQLRRELERIRVGGQFSGGPSVLLRLRSATGEGRPDARLEPLERSVREELRNNGFVLLDAGALPGRAPEQRGLLELARAIRADVAVDVRVALRRGGIGSRMVSVTADVTALAIRVQDAFELARVQLETPAYHTDPEEAAMRALDATREPLARNLRVQLDRNWGALAADRGQLRLVLRGVRRFTQVTEVWDLLSSGSEIEGVQLRVLAPGTAEFFLREAPSPGVLQSRLARSDLPGFRLEPLAMAADRLEFTVREHPADPSSQELYFP